MRQVALSMLLALSAHAADAGAPVSPPPPAPMRGVLVLPPVMTVLVGKKPFAGIDTRKPVERFDLVGHKKLVSAVDAKLGGKVLPADITIGLLTKENLTPTTLDAPGALQKLAEAANVEWLVRFTLNKSVLRAQVVDRSGQPVGTSASLNEATTLTDTQATSLAANVVSDIETLERARIAGLIEAARSAEAERPPPPEELVDTDLELMKKKKTTESTSWSPNPSRVRAWVAVGPGAVLRDLSLQGEATTQLAELENGAVVGLGVAAQVLPLELFDATAGKAWSQLSLEVHYRRAFVQARGVAGGLENAPCTMTDDDLQLRAGWRYRLGDGYLPTIGVAGGWSQEQTRFECNLPLVSTTWRGVDAQLRIRQPLFRDIVTLELVGGPRFVLPGPLAATPGFSLSAEAWLEVKPVSVLFGRAGARMSRLQAANPALQATDTRAFFALELGAFF